MAAHHVYESIHITGATNFPNFYAELPPDLSVIVGPTGSGKTSLADIFRYAADAPPPLSEKERLRYESQVADTLGPGTVDLVIRSKHGERYRIERKRGTPPRVFRLADLRDKVGTELTGIPLSGELFDSEHYGPGELNSLALDRSGQLALIDRFAHGEIQRVTEEIARLHRRLAQNDTELTRLARELAEDAETIAHLPETQEALAALERADGPGADEIKQAHEAKALRGRERTAVVEIEQSLSRARDEVGALAKGMMGRIGSAVDARFETGPHGDTFHRLHAAARGASVAMEDGAARLRDAIAGAERVVGEETRALAALHGREDDAYHALLARQNEDKERAAERVRLQKLCEGLLHAKKRESERRAEHDAKRAERKTLLEEWARLHVERYQTRKRAVAWIGERLPPYVKIDVACGTDHGAYHALLVKVLEGSGTRKDLIANVAGAIAPEDLADAVLRNDTERIMRVDEMKSGKADRAKTFLDVLRKSGRLSEIETVGLVDSPMVGLELAGEVQASHRVSTGQQATCILAVALLRLAGPLVLDQPEDQLDNSFVFNVFVQQLLALKEDRQIIIVSHNPNVPLLAEPSRVFMLGARGRETYLYKVGTPAELAEELEALMEGGRVAFLGRGERYGHTIVAKKT